MCFFFLLIFLSQALIEEAEVCLAEIRKERYEFEREVVKGAMDVRMNIIKAEKCMKYFEQKLKYRVNEDFMNNFTVIVSTVSISCYIGNCMV